MLRWILGGREAQGAVEVSIGECIDQKIKKPEQS